MALAARMGTMAEEQTIETIFSKVMIEMLSFTNPSPRL
jgi:hypothetical protein